MPAEQTAIVVRRRHAMVIVASQVGRHIIEVELDAAAALSLLEALHGAVSDAIDDAQLIGDRALAELDEVVGHG